MKSAKVGMYKHIYGKLQKIIKLEMLAWAVKTEVPNHFAIPRMHLGQMGM